MEADVVTAMDYYPFGMSMPGRTYTANSTSYRYGFNGKEKDLETTGTSTYDYGFRIYNPALARFLSMDPLTKSYPWFSPFQYASNNPVVLVDLDGMEGTDPPDLRVNIFIFPSNLFDLKGGNIAQISGFLQAKAQELLGNKIIAIQADNTAHAYNQIFSLKTAGAFQHISNMVFETHGHEGLGFSVGTSSNYENKSSKSDLKVLTAEVEGYVVIMGCQLGMNIGGFMNNTAKAINKKVIASQGWVMDYPGMFNDKVGMEKGIEIGVGWAWDNVPSFKNWVYSQLSDQEILKIVVADLFGIDTDVIIKKEVKDRIIKEIAPLTNLMDGDVSPSGTPDIFFDPFYYNPNNPKNAKIFERVGKWNVFTANGKSEEFTLKFDSDGDVFRTSVPFYETAFGKEYKNMVDKVKEIMKTVPLSKI
jgi:RHS repeat-associated protein